MNPYSTRLLTSTPRKRSRFSVHTASPTRVSTSTSSSRDRLLAFKIRLLLEGEMPPEGEREALPVLFRPSFRAL